MSHSSLQNQTLLITGANRGIGFSIVQATSLRYPNNTYILACRSLSSGNEAVGKLRALGAVAPLEVLELDITSDESILVAVETVKKKWGSLDVLINNAGIAVFPTSQDLADLRSNFTTTFNANITSLYAVTTAFLPLLHHSNASEPKVINLSSGRASLTRSSGGKLPKTQVVAYGVSKTAVNALTVEMQKGEVLLGEEKVEGEGEGRGKTAFWAVNPGHCKTAFNNFRGTKDPLEGAEVVVRLVGSEKGEFKKGGFWEFEEGAMREVPW